MTDGELSLAHRRCGGTEPRAPVASPDRAARVRSLGFPAADARPAPALGAKDLDKLGGRRSRRTRVAAQRGGSSYTGHQRDPNGDGNNETCRRVCHRPRIDASHAGVDSLPSAWTIVGQENVPKDPATERTYFRHVQPLHLVLPGRRARTRAATGARTSAL